MKKIAEIGWITTGALFAASIVTIVGISLGTGATCIIVTSIPGGYYCDLHIEQPK